MRPTGETTIRRRYLLLLEGARGRHAWLALEARSQPEALREAAELVRTRPSGLLTCELREREERTPLPAGVSARDLEEVQDAREQASASVA